MKLIEIVETVDVLVPNAIPLEKKVVWINQIQNQLYRDYPLPESVHAFVFEPGQSFYELPAECPSDRILEIVVPSSNRTYPFLPIRSPDAFTDLFCTMVNGMLMVHPTPREESYGFMYYKPRPIQMTATAGSAGCSGPANGLDDEPSFPVDFHELLVFGTASRVAKSNPATLALAQQFDSDYRSLAEKADLVLRVNRPTKVAIARQWA